MENTENTTNLIKIPIEDEVKQAFIDYSICYCKSCAS